MSRAAALVLVAAVITSQPASAADPVSAEQVRAVLTPGQQVKVEGVAQAGVFHARLVAVRDLNTSAKVEGLVELASADRRTLRVNGFQVLLDAATRLYRGAQVTTNRSMLAPGAWLEAKGAWRDGAIKAARIRVKDAAEPTAEIEGPIDTFESETSTLVVLNRQIVVDPDVDIVDERTGSAAPRAAADRLRRDDDDGQGSAPLVFGNVVLGGRIGAGFEHKQNYGDHVGGAERSGLSRLQVLGSSQLTDRIEAYAKATFDGSVGSVAARDLRVSEAYLQFSDVASLPVSLQVGRQRFRDAREWLFDEYLDAVRVHATLPRVKFEAAVAHGLLSGPASLRARRDQLQALVSAGGRVSNVRWAVHTVARRDESRGERPVWFAGLVEGGGDRFAYWTNAAVRRGVAADTRLRGWTVDTGVRRTWSRRWRPALTIGYAFASGDSTRGDGIDTRFRQTGLQDNQAYFGGLRRIATYGELFDPELSNLDVWTAALGVQPRRGLALDAIYHEYTQAKPTASLPSSNLDGALTGSNRWLGREIDVLLTLRARRGVDVDLATGLFQRGPAFSFSTTPAFFWRPQLRFYF